jgi:hypothetical protein
MQPQPPEVDAKFEEEDHFTKMRAKHTAGSASSRGHARHGLSGSSLDVSRRNRKLGRIFTENRK